MPRPSNITTRQITIWDDKLENDPLMPDLFKSNMMLKEIIYASYWLKDELIKLDCTDPILIFQFVYTLGYNSFDRDPWDEAMVLLQSYQKQDYQIDKELN